MGIKNEGLAGIVLAIGLVAAGSVHAQATATEERLRDQLRQTTLQLRDAQDTVTDLKAQLERATAQLESQRAAVTSAAQTKSAGKETAELQRAVDERNQRITEVQERLEQSQTLLGQWQQAYNQAAALAKARDADAKRFEAQLTDTNARVQKCTNDNAELVSISNRILDRYKKKGVWSALRDDEPVTRIHRIRLEALAQDYHASIVDHSITPHDAPNTPTAPPK